MIIFLASLISATNDVWIRVSTTIFSCQSIKHVGLADGKTEFKLCGLNNLNGQDSFYQRV